MSRQSIRLLGIGLLGLVLLPAGPVAAARRIPVGQPLPAFRLVDVPDANAAYRPGHDRAAVVAFLSTRHARFEAALNDLRGILRGLGPAAANVDVFILVDDPNRCAAWRTSLSDFRGGLYVSADPNRTVYGRFGVIARPTVAVAGRDGTVLRVAAGYSYEFGALIRSALYGALGLDAGPAPEAGVVTLVNDTKTARIQRLLRTAAVLRERGHVDAALTELQRARDLDPNAATAAWALAEMHCLQGNGAAALAALEAVTAERPADRARTQRLRGWAYRLSESWTQAEAALQEAATLDPRNAETHYLLGRVYELQGRQEAALTAYREALRLAFGPR